LNPRWTVVDLSALTGALLGSVREQFPDRQIEIVAPHAVSLQADTVHLSLTLQLLLRAACQLAARSVRVSVTTAHEVVVWSIQRDGPPLNEEQRVWLERPFTTTRHALFGLGLALAQRVVDCQGGKVMLENPDEGGARLTLQFPADSAENSMSES
jgi:signal transduction histidine kinase